MAIRNIFRNKKNSIIIIVLISVITAVFFIGNSILNRSNQGLKQSYIENLTGDIVIQKISDISMNLFGVNTPVIEEFFTIPAVPAYDMVMDIVQQTSGIALVTGQVSGQAVMDLHGARQPVLIAGVDGDEYFHLLPGIVLEEGTFLQTGESGAMMTKAMADQIEKDEGVRPAIGDPVLLTAAFSWGVKIREVPLAGIFSYTNPGQLMDQIVLIDAQNARILSAIQVASADVEVSDDAIGLLDDDVDFSIDDLFGGTEEEYVSEEELFSIDFLEEYLNTESETESVEVSGGDYNFILLKIQDNVSVNKVIRELNKQLSDYGVVAVGWRTAAGLSAILASLVQTLFNAGLVLVSIACIIAIINILLIAVFRRTREVGTLRAIGASDGYIRALILSENTILSFAAGIVGVILGIILIAVINNAQFVVGNELIASVLGGSVIELNISFGVSIVSLFVAVTLGFLASLYPVQIAVKIDPIIAVRQG
jgi:putative ABC transport system permease protein